MTLPQREYDKHHQDHHNHNNYYNNNYNSAHEPGRTLTEDESAAIFMAYTDNIGRINMAIANMIVKAVEAGISAENILKAIDLTALAPRPSAYYLRAILRNWAANGVTLKREEPTRPTNPALNYDQRHYTEADYAKLYVDLTKYADE